MGGEKGPLVEYCDGDEGRSCGGCEAFAAVAKSMHAAMSAQHLLRRPPATELHTAEAAVMCAASCGSPPIAHLHHDIKCQYWQVGSSTEHVQPVQGNGPIVSPVGECHAILPPPNTIQQTHIAALQPIRSNSSSLYTELTLIVTAGDTSCDGEHID